MLLKRPVTRLPYPLASQVRRLAVALPYRLLGWFLAPAFRRRITLDELSKARVLILKPCCLGDVVFATPLLRELRRALPNAHFTFAVGAHSRPAIAGNPAVDALLDTGRVGSGPYDLGEFVNLIREIRARRFDACFVLERSALLALLPLLAGVPIRVGIDSGGRGFSLGVAVPVRPARPESELYLDLLRALGGRPRSPELEYHPSSQAVQRVDQLVKERIADNRPFVVLHGAGGANPGMVLPRKRWPAESFRELAERVVQAGATPVLVGSPDDRETADEILAGPHPRPLSICAQMERGAGRAGAERPSLPLSISPEMERGQGGEARPPFVDLVGKLTLDELAELARRAAVYVGNDSGPSHLAEAAGANVVMLFGPSDAIVYGPRRRAAVALSAGFWCSPCFEDGRVAPCANVICMRSISVDRVWNEVARFLANREQVR